MTEQVNGRRPASRRLVILGGVLVVLVVLAGLGIRFWYSPLGPGLADSGAEAEAQIVATAVAQGTPQATAIAAVAETAAAPVATGSVQANTPEPAPTAVDDGANSESACNGPAMMSLLVLGIDTRDETYTSGRADFIRAVRLDFQAEAVRMLSVPRDLWLTIPGLEEHGVHQNRVNEAFEFGNLYQRAGGGPSLMADTLSLNLGLSFDHYVVVNFAAVEKGIDAIGGLDINLPEDVDGTHQGFPYFHAGPNHMDGKTLVQYVRIRYIDNDLYRIDRQNQVIVALRAKLLSPSVAPALPELLSAMTELIDTDLSPSQLSSVLCLGQRVGLDQFDSVKIGGPEVVEFIAPDGHEALLPNFDAIELVLKVFLAVGSSIG